MKRKTITKALSNQTYVTITYAEMGNQTVGILSVNIERSSSFGYHFVSGWRVDSNNVMYTYFDGAITGQVPIMVEYYSF